jgi:gas vesicle protein
MISTEVLIAISGASTGAIVGAISTLAVQEYRERRRRERRRKNIQRSLHSEIKQGVEIIGDYKNAGAATGGLIPTASYEAVSDEIGLLKPEQAKKVIEYYTQAKHFNGIGSKIESIPRDEFNGMTEPVEVSEWKRARTETIDLGEEAVNILPIEK